MPERIGVALVTGATEGIGRATAVALGRAGFALGVCSRRAGKVTELLAALRQEGIPCAGGAADVADPAAVKALVAGVVETLGRVDVLVNNAGVLIARPFAELTLDDWDRTMSTNLRSLFIVTKEVLPGMRERRQGTIVNVASLAGKNGFAGGAAYSASKHAVLGFSRSLMLEVRKEGVRVIAVCPGSVATGMMQDQPMLQANAERILQPEDVASVIVEAVTLPGRALVSELDIRPTSP
jgi:3-oxoacyl-[acyl-carrier protein] reductase